MAGRGRGRYKAAMASPTNSRPPRRGPPPQRRPRPGTRPPAEGPLHLYGLHTVEFALKNPARTSRKLLATLNAAARLAERFPEGLPIEPELVRPQELDRLVGPDAVHQGAVLLAEPLEPPDLAALGPAALVLVLDQVTDPHNVGAILRTACALGAAAVITTERHSPAESGVLAKAASGALDLVPFIHVRNLGDAIETLKREGFQVVGLDSEGEAPLARTPMRAPLALVLGSEGKGLRQKTRGLCDVLARIELPGPIKSLNVSNACALALYAASEAIGAADRGA